MPRAGPLLALCASIVLVGCGPRSSENADPEGEMERTRPIEEVLADSTPAWMAVPGVSGTGLGSCDGEPCIVVFLSRRTPEVEERIPATVEGHRVRVEVSGRFVPREPEEP